MREPAGESAQAFQINPDLVTPGVRKISKGLSLRLLFLPLLSLALIGFLADPGRSQMDRFRLGDTPQAITAGNFKILAVESFKGFECFKVEGTDSISMLRFKDGRLASISGMRWWKSLSTSDIELGASRAKIVKALGAPDEHDPSKDIDTYHLHYLGMPRGDLKILYFKNQALGLEWSLPYLELPKSNS